MKIIAFFKKIIHFLQGRCYFCGGGLYIWDEKKAYCKECGKED